MALALADKINGDIVIGTDPDSDRLGVAVRDTNGQMILLNGNQTMVIMTAFLLEQWKRAGTITGKEFIGSTIVSTPMMLELASAYGVECKVGLTGFKWIAVRLLDLVQQDHAEGLLQHGPGQRALRAKAIADQAQRYIHAQVNVFKHDLLEPLAAKLAEITPAGIDTFFYANSGAEITEAAVKLAQQATKRPRVIVFSGSFHGRTHLAMAMTTSKTGYRAGHAPLPAGVFVAPYPDPLAPDQDAEVADALHDFDHLLKAMTAQEETAAVILQY